jgi:YD repeat-containing protein
MPHAPSVTSQGKVVNVYDSMGRLATSTAPDGRVTSHAYFTAKTATSTPSTLFGGSALFATVRTDPNGRTEYQVVDHAGLPTNAIQVSPTGASFPAAPAETTYTYGPFGVLRTVRDAEQQVTSIGTDLLGRRTSLSEPSVGVSGDVLNAFGESVQHIDANGRRTCNSYDSLGRLRSVRQPNANLVCPIGRIVASWDYGDASTPEENTLGRLVRSFRAPCPVHASCSDPDAGTTVR